MHFIENDLMNLVPASNHITLDLKFHIVSYFGRIHDLQWRDLTEEELQCKAKYCHDLITVLDQVTRGDSQKKG